jgi:glycosyltransferase involved in cell wall biosynthesis
MAVHRLLFELCDAVICHCEAAAGSVAEAYELDPELRRRLHVIPHGNYIDVYPNTLSRAEARSRLGLPEGARVLLFIGAVRAYKGIEELLAAFRTLDEPNARLVVAGSPRRPSDRIAARPFTQATSTTTAVPFPDIRASLVGTNCGREGVA